MIETVVVREQLQSAHGLIGPGMIPAHPLVSGHAGQDLRPGLVERLHRRPRRPPAIEIQFGGPAGTNRGEPSSAAAAAFSVTRGARRGRVQLQCQFPASHGVRPSHVRGRDTATDRATAGHLVAPITRPVLRRRPRRQPAKPQEDQQHTSFHSFGLSSSDVGRIAIRPTGRPTLCLAAP